MRPIIGVVAILFLSLVTAGPLAHRSDLPQPNKDSIFAMLEGLPPCYAKCFISEKHWDAFKPMSTKVGRWCHMSDYWRSYHLIPCVKKTCEVNKFERKTGGKWWLSHCTGKNGPGG